MNIRFKGSGCALLVMLALCGCAQMKQSPALPEIQRELRQATAAPRAAPLPAAVMAALAPESQLSLPTQKAAQPLEPRFDLAVNDAPAQQVFMGIASGTRYSMLLQPDLAGTITVDLKDVSVPEAMSALRELYGYDYRIEDHRIYVQALTAQTRFYSIDYPSAVREGKSELRVISGAVTDSSSSGSGSSGGAGSSSSTKQLETSHVSTVEKNDFWSELQASVGLLIGCSGSAASLACPVGHSLMVSPHAGMLAVRALPAEQRQVAEYLKAAKISVERQVMIEAKILEVTLNEGAQSGINWAAIGSGPASPFALSSNLGQATFPSSSTPFLSTTQGFGVLNQAASNGISGVAFQTNSFAALVHFLESQGEVQVLSSPRIAAINDQTAVLKVGTDDFFVTNVSTTTSSSGATSGTTTPNVTLQPFFSGISLDVTPQIDAGGDIILHVHPAVSQVTTNTQSINLGTSIGSMTLPLASSSTSETDSIVRLHDGEIAAIGGLMKLQTQKSDSGVPGLSRIPGLGELFKYKNVSHLKQELVILLKPTVIRQQADWQGSAREVQARIDKLESR